MIWLHCDYNTIWCLYLHNHNIIGHLSIWFGTCQSTTSVAAEWVRQGKLLTWCQLILLNFVVFDTGAACELLLFRPPIPPLRIIAFQPIPWSIRVWYVTLFVSARNQNGLFCSCVRRHVNGLHGVSMDSLWIPANLMVFTFITKKHLPQVGVKHGTFTIWK